MHPLLQLGLGNALMVVPLALLAAVVGRRSRRPALTHALWLLVLLKLVTPPLIPFPISWPTDWPADLAADPTPGMDRPVRSVAAPAISWPAALGVLWLTGTALYLGVALVRVLRFQRLLRHTQPASAEVQAEAAALVRRLGCKDGPRVLLLPGALPPLLWSVGRCTCLVMPASLLERLDGEQRRALLAHELAHWRRHDHWVRYLELAALALYWWLPLAWWARRELRAAEEECCDAWVVWLLPQATRAYATALVETLDFLAQAPPALPATASGLGQFAQLRRRLTLILRGATPRALPLPGLLAVGGLALALLPVAPGLAHPAPIPAPSATVRAGLERQTAGRAAESAELPPVPHLAGQVFAAEDGVAPAARQNGDGFRAGPERPGVFPRGPGLRPNFVGAGFGPKGPPPWRGGPPRKGPGPRGGGPPGGRGFGPPPQVFNGGPFPPGRPG